MTKEPVGHNQVDQDMYCLNPKKKRGKGVERMFEKIIAENVQNLMKDIEINTQEAQNKNKIKNKKLQ